MRIQPGPVKKIGKIFASEWFRRTRFSTRSLRAHTLSAEQELAEFGSMKLASLRRMNVGSSNILRRIRGDSSADMRETAETTHRRKSTINCSIVDAARARCSMMPIQLDVWPGCFENGDVGMVRPPEK
jgi:hypothetical protein